MTTKCPQLVPSNFAYISTPYLPVIAINAALTIFLLGIFITTVVKENNHYGYYFTHWALILTILSIGGITILQAYAFGYHWVTDNAHWIQSKRTMMVMRWYGFIVMVSAEIALTWELLIAILYWNYAPFGELSPERQFLSVQMHAVAGIILLFQLMLSQIRVEPLHGGFVMVATLIYIIIMDAAYMSDDDNHNHLVYEELRKMKVAWEMDGDVSILGLSGIMLSLVCISFVGALFLERSCRTWNRRCRKVEE